MNPAGLQGQITLFLREETNAEVPSPDVDLVEEGFLDSLTFVALLVYLEETFGLTVGIDDLDMANFCSIMKIAGFVMRRSPDGSALQQQPQPLSG